MGSIVRSQFLVDCAPRILRIAGADGICVSLSVFEPASPRAAVIIAAAAAVKRSYYGEFAQFLADNGLAAVRLTTEESAIPLFHRKRRSTYE